MLSPRREKSEKGGVGGGLLVVGEGLLLLSPRHRNSEKSGLSLVGEMLSPRQRSEKGERGEMLSPRQSASAQHQHRGRNLSALGVYHVPLDTLTKCDEVPGLPKIVYQFLEYLATVGNETCHHESLLLCTCACVRL